MRKAHHADIRGQKNRAGDPLGVDIIPLGENKDIPDRRQARYQNASIHPERIELRHPSENEPYEQWANSEFGER